MEPPIDWLTIWASLSPEEQELWLKDEGGAYTERLEALFGEELKSVQDAALEGAPEIEDAKKQPVVFLPGGGGSELHSVRGTVTRLYLEPRVILGGKGELLRLNPKGNAGANPAVETVATRPMPRAYDGLRLFLGKRTRLHEFPYDWRLSIRRNGRLLGQAIKRWAKGLDGQRFHLVCHSMGGLVARAYLAQYPDAAQKRVAQVIMLGTPHYGTIDGLMKVARGDLAMKIYQKLNPKNAPLSIARTMPGLFQTMPPPRGIWTTYQEDKVLKIPYPVDKGWDLYSASSWHPPKVLQQRLDDARELHQLLRDSKSQVPLVEIAGCNVKTAVGVQRNGKSFKLICESEGPNSGDGTIPLWSTRPPRGTRYLIHQNHSGLPKDRQVQRAVMSLIRGETNIDLPTDTCDQAGALSPGAWDTAGLGANELDKIAEQVAPRLRLALEGKVFALSDLPLLRFGL